MIRNIELIATAYVRACTVLVTNMMRTKLELDIESEEAALLRHADQYQDSTQVSIVIYQSIYLSCPLSIS